ncbi:MAG: hypothetical protein KDA22_13365 [Phycisphaerales bacterium]|nr:hypothetical protein [Phycisphaerales bacterium]
MPPSNAPAKVEDGPNTTAAAAPAVLFTAFEPSGDAHAAPVIAALKRQRPELRIYAWGGQRMEEAGATIVERSADDGAMGLGAVSRALAVRSQIARIRRWSRTYRVLVHVPVDSPAANFPIAKSMAKAGARVVHLVAPQLWAWGAWRVGKLRRCTSEVLCLLPFEERWFRERQIQARFIGHPVLNRELDEAQVRERAASLPGGSPKIAIFPGSRTQEVRRNIRLLATAFTELQGRHTGMGGLIVAANDEIARLVRRRVPVFPTGLHMTVGGIDAAVRWCDLALAVSGTVTLDVAKQCRPMIGVYRTGIVSWLGAKVILRTPYRLLPNIIAGREIVPEFVPHVGGPGPILHAATELLRDSRRLALQREELSRAVARFRGHDPANEAAESILKFLPHAPATATSASPGTSTEKRRSVR